MVKFIIRAGDFKKFLDTVSCKGTLQFKSKGKVDSTLFSSFYINAEDNELEVLTIDTFFTQIKQNSTIKAVVKEKGILEITDKSAFDVIFSSMDSNYPITVSSDGKTIVIENDYGDWYKRRIIGDKSFDEIDGMMSKLKGWKEAHELINVENGEIWEITVPEGTAIYPMRIKTTKKDLKKFVEDSLKLTKDNNTIIISKDGVVQIWTGKPNSINQSKHTLSYQNVGAEIFDFSVKFSALQAIVPNLLDDVYLSFRKTGIDTIILRIESFDKNMKQIIALGSQDRDGVIYDDEETIE